VGHGPDGIGQSPVVSATILVTEAITTTATATTETCSSMVDSTRLDTFRDAIGNVTRLDGFSLAESTKSHTRLRMVALEVHLLYNTMHFDE
jgi:hypothetical protein